MWGLFSKRSREQAPPQPVSLVSTKLVHLTFGSEALRTANLLVVRLANCGSGRSQNGTLKAGQREHRFSIMQNRLLVIQDIPAKFDRCLGRQSAIRERFCDGRRNCLSRPSGHKAHLWQSTDARRGFVGVAHPSLMHLQPRRVDP
jgi:hypothetical protein